MKIGDYETHPIADAFPLLQGEDFERFKQGIKDNGLRDRDVALYQGKILDARNRYRACLDLGAAFVKKLRFVEVEGDPFVYVIDHNINDRRHLNESQRVIALCWLLKLKPGRPKKNRLKTELTAGEAAKAAGVSESSIERGKAVLNTGVAELVTAVEAGEIGLLEASQMAKLPEDEQRDALERRKDRVKRSDGPRQGYGNDPIEAVRTIIMKAVREAGAAVRARPASDGSILEVGYRSQGVVITLERVEAS